MINNLKHISQRSLILMISPLKGTGLNQVLYCIPQHSHLVNICFSEAHHIEYQLEFQSHQKYFDIPQHLQLLYQDSLSSQLAYIIHTHYIQTCHIIYYSQEAYQYKEEAESLLYNCQVEIKQTWINHLTQVNFGAKWFHNIWQNLCTSSYKLGIPEIIIPSNTKNSVAIVVGAGPSLQRPQLEFIKEHQKKCTIFAVDTAMPILKKYGIVPHFCILLESQFYNMQDLIPAPHPDTIAIGDICCYPSSLRAFNRCAKICTKFTNISFFENFKDMLPPIIPPLGSVGILAMYLAIKSNPTHIIFTGLDFSYQRGLSHAPHAPAHVRWIREQNRLMPWDSFTLHTKNKYLMSVESIHKNTHTLVQDPTLKAFGRKFERFIIPFAQDNNISCMDLNPASIIEGIIPIKLQEAQSLMRYARSDIQIAWKHSIDAFDIGTISHTTQIANAKKILGTMHTQSKHIAQRMRELASINSIPLEDDWNSGLDNYSFMLNNDPYLVKHDENIWTTHNLYSTIYLHASRIHHDISHQLEIKEVH